jgi:hypothetical protein
MVSNGNKKINVWFWLVMFNIRHHFWLLVTHFDSEISRCFKDCEIPHGPHMWGWHSDPWNVWLEFNFTEVAPSSTHFQVYWIRILTQSKYLKSTRNFVSMHKFLEQRLQEMIISTWRPCGTMKTKWGGEFKTTQQWNGKCPCMHGLWTTHIMFLLNSKRKIEC